MSTDLSATTTIKVRARAIITDPIPASAKRGRATFITHAYMSAEVSAETTELGRQYIHTSVAGVYAKKDGTAGKAPAYVLTNELPEDVRAELRAGLDRALAAERARLRDVLDATP